MVIRCGGCGWVDIGDQEKREGNRMTRASITLASPVMASGGGGVFVCAGNHRDLEAGMGLGIV